jgi:hypothetical protein
MAGNSYESLQKSFLVLVFAVQWLELRDSCLLGRHSTSEKLLLKGEEGLGDSGSHL